MVRAKLSYPRSEADQERRKRAMRVVVMKEPGEGRVKYLVDTFEWLLSLGGGGGDPTVQNREAARWKKDKATATATVSLPCCSNS